MRSSLLLTVVAGLALSACASVSEFTRGSDSEPSGIQTQAYGAAPATQTQRVTSKPLSETNSPDAVAARQAQARASGKPVPKNLATQAAVAAPKAPVVPVIAAAKVPAAAPQAPVVAARGEPAAPHAQVAGFEKGRKVSVRPGAAIRSRPSSSSDAIQSLVMDAQVTLDSRVYNAEGYWWYALTGAEDGWIAQGDLLQP